MSFKVGNKVVNKYLWDHLTHLVGFSFFLSFFSCCIMSYLICKDWRKFKFRCRFYRGHCNCSSLLHTCTFLACLCECNVTVVPQGALSIHAFGRYFYLNWLGPEAESRAVQLRHQGLTLALWQVQDFSSEPLCLLFFLNLRWLFLSNSAMWNFEIVPYDCFCRDFGDEGPDTQLFGKERRGIRTRPQRAKKRPQESCLYP